ncbi:MAG: SBBP repeat-containing protein [Bryobacterales bacterium]|nr:SBBP repeat-containing protein [Bryobacterales bacterium]
MHNSGYTAILGGRDSEEGYGVGIDGGGNAYLSGNTRSRDFPTTPGVFQPEWKGSDDVYVAIINAAGTELIYSTFLGGSGTDSAYRFALDRSGNAYVAGETRSRDFPLTGDVIQSKFTSSYQDHELFLSRIDPNGAVLTYSTYLGGSSDNKATRIVVGPEGKVWLVGLSASTEFTTTSEAAQKRPGGFYDAFVIQLSDLGSSNVADGNRHSKAERRPGLTTSFSRLKRLLLGLPGKREPTITTTAK